MPHNLFALLPELLMTITGVIVMLVEPVLPRASSRKGLGWLAIFGTVAAGAATWYQHRWIDAEGGLPLSAFYSTISIDEFSVFFHLLIAAIVIAVLLASLDYFEGPTTHAGEYFALVLFGATGMMFMTCSVELLMVFIGLEISSISTYILAGFRKGQATASESSIKYFLLGSLCYGILPLRHRPLLRCHRLHPDHRNRRRHGPHRHAAYGPARHRHGPYRPWLQSLRRPVPRLDSGRLPGRPRSGRGPHVHRAQGRRLRRPAPLPLQRRAPAFTASGSSSSTSSPSPACASATSAPCCSATSSACSPTRSIAHAGYLLAAFTATEPTAVAGACFYTAAYAAMNVGAFLVLTELSGYAEGARSIEDFTGIAQRKPVLSGLLAFFLLSLIGIPFTGGFFGKFYAFSAAISNGYVWLALIGLLNSGVACFYYLRLLAALYARPTTDSLGYAPTRKLTVPAGLALAGTALATLVLGIFPGHMLNLVQRASPQPVPAYSVPTPPEAPATADTSTPAGNDQH